MRVNKRGSVFWTGRCLIDCRLETISNNYRAGGCRIMWNDRGPSL